MKRAKEYFKELVFRLWMKFHKKPKFNHKYYVAVCAIFKNEAQNFKEWIEYNKIIGIEHFYLYNNNSTDNYMEVLKPYIEEGMVTVIDWPENGTQALAYNHCLLNHRHEAYWLAYIDIDEFICPIYEWSFKNWLKKYENFPAIFINWIIFGSSGLLQDKPENLVMENYTQSSNHFVNSGKSIINTHYDWDYGIHYMPLRLHFGIAKLKCNFILNEKNMRIKKLTTGDLKIANPTIQLNHYIIKSYNNYLNKITKGRGTVDVSKYPQYKLKEKAFWEVEELCASKDFKILKYASKLKKALKHGKS